MLFTKKTALIVSLLFCFSPPAFGAEEQNNLLLRVVLGNLVLSEGIAGEERNGEIYVELSELSEVLEESPRAGVVLVRALADIFPARFEANLLRQELRVFGRGELGIERRLITEVSARRIRPSAPHTLIPPTDEWFSTPFVQATHRVTHASSGEYMNTDSLRLFGVFLRGDSSFVVSEREGKFSYANWAWRRKGWRAQTSYAENGAPHFSAISRRFSSEDSHLDAELSYHGTEKTAASFNAATILGDINADIGVQLGKRELWRTGLSGEIFSGGWNITHLGYSDEIVDSNSRVGFFSPLASGYYAFSKYNQGVDSHEGQLNFSFPLGKDFSGKIHTRILHRTLTKKEGKISLTRRYHNDKTHYSIRFSHERTFSLRESSRTNLLLERSESGDSFSARASYFDEENFNDFRADLNWRRPLFSEKMMLDTGASFTDKGFNSAFIAISYTLARDTKNERWSAHNKFRHGALSACAVNAKGDRAASGGPYRLKNGTLMNENGCAFVPYTGGKIALDEAKIPPWIYVRKKEGDYARAIPGKVIHVDFNVISSGEAEGVLSSSGMLLYGMAVLLIPVAEEGDFLPDVCVGEMRTGTPPPSISEENIRETRTVFDGHYYFNKVEVGEYIIASDNKWRRVRIAEGESCTANLNLPLQ